MGPLHGGTAVNLSMGIAIGPGAICRFNGQNETTATVASNGMSLLCTSPPSYYEQWVALEVKTLAYTQRVFSRVADFYYHAPMLVSSVYPQLGPMRGGTQVEVRGNGFLRAGNGLHCGWRVNSSLLLLTVAWWSEANEGSRVRCVSPEYNELGLTEVSLCTNGQQFVWGAATFLFQPVVTVASVWPPMGASEGGTPLTVVGGGFTSASEALGMLHCRFNGTVVHAAYVSASALACNTTALIPGQVSVEVSTNGREYSSSGVQFELISLLMQDLTPWSGPVLGGTVVTIAGTGLACR